MKPIATLKHIFFSSTFRVAFSIGLLVLLASWVDFAEISKEIAQANYSYLGLALILMTLNRVLMPLKWNLLLRSHKLHLGWKDSVSIYYVSTFFGLFLPATVGADSLRAYYTKQRGISLDHGLASIMVERVLGALTTLSFGVLGGILFVVYFAADEANVEFLIAIALSILGMFILIFLGTLSTAFANFEAKIAAKYQGTNTLSKIVGALHKLYTAYAQYRDQKKAMFIFILLTIVETSLPVLWSWLVGLAIGIDSVELMYYCAFVPIVLLLIRLPISLDGFGINEGAYVYFLGLVGVSSAAGFSIGFITHILFLVALLPGILVYLLNSSSFTSPKTVKPIEGGS